MPRKLIILMLGCLALLASQAGASVSYQYVTDQSDYQVPSGSAITAYLYLQETCTDGDPSLLDAESGLLGGGVSIARSNVLPSSPTDITGIDGETVTNFANGSIDMSFDSGSASLLEGISFEPGTPGAVVVDLGGGIRRVLLGTLSLTAGNVDGEQTLFTLDKHDELGGSTVTFANFLDLDSTSIDPAFVGATSSTFTVTTLESIIPEPASLGLLGIAAAIMGLRRRPR